MWLSSFIAVAYATSSEVLPYPCALNGEGGGVTQYINKACTWCTGYYNMDHVCRTFQLVKGAVGRVLVPVSPERSGRGAALVQALGARSRAPLAAAGP